MKIVVGTDESRPVVDQLVAHLKSKGHTVDALPAETWGRMAAHTARLVADRSYDRGIVCCWTGTGASIAANKVNGIRAALCTSGYMAEMTRRHNDSNILCLGGKVTGEFELWDIVERWLANEYEGGRHAISLGLIGRAEEDILTDHPDRLANTPREDEL